MVLDDGSLPFSRADDAWVTFSSADGLPSNWAAAPELLRRARILVVSRGIVRVERFRCGRLRAHLADGMGLAFRGRVG